MKSSVVRWSIVFTAVAFLALAGLNFGLSSQAVDAAGTTKAVAVLVPTSGNNVHGTITFTQQGDKVHVVGDIEGLAPGTHGFHIHECGDCSAPDGTSAGGHFNPANHSHGAPADANRHVGDLGNITADSAGKAHIDITDATLSLDGANSIIGRGVIVHAVADDLKTQPTGNAGARVACGVVGIGK
jgi:Cu-Zn family superoxide dismutase